MAEDRLYAANLLRLSEQVPARVVFLTDGKPRRLNYGRQVIELRRASPRMMAAAGRMTGLVIAGLRYVGVDTHPGGREAATRLDLLERVRIHKSRFFVSGWAHYETAVPGTLRFVPPDARLAELRRDYTAMEPMFLSPPPHFDAVLATLREAEETINRGYPRN